MKGSVLAEELTFVPVSIPCSGLHVLQELDNLDATFFGLFAHAFLLAFVDDIRPVIKRSEKSSEKQHLGSVVGECHGDASIESGSIESSTPIQCD